MIKTNKNPSPLIWWKMGDSTLSRVGCVNHLANGRYAPDMDLTIEKNLMLAYKMPFFFVSRNNPTLAVAIETGLNRAIADGSFDETFMNAPSVKDVIKKANMKNQRGFYIDNPTLSKETSLDRKELWFDSKELP